MSECKYDRMANRYIDGELSPGEAAKFEQHLEECRYCQDMVKDLESINDLLSMKSRVRPDPEFMRKIMRMQTVAKVESVWESFDRMAKKLFPVAACLCVLLSAMLFMQTNRHTTIQTQVTTTDSIGSADTEDASDTVFMSSVLTDTEKNILLTNEDKAIEYYYRYQWMPLLEENI